MCVLLADSREMQPGLDHLDSVLMLTKNDSVCVAVVIAGDSLL